MIRVRLRIRPLADYTELQACVDLQKATWGSGFDDLVPAAIMRVTQRIGGVAAGAFDGSGRLVGTIFGLTGMRNGEAVHWSHMLAVAPEWQGWGVGAALKAYQRRRVMEIGVRAMYWTFDPLEARNAHFNLNRLGARISEYIRDAYGSGESSPLHRGIGTDRFVATWHLERGPLTVAMQRLDAEMSWDADMIEARLELPMDVAGGDPTIGRANPHEPAGGGRSVVVEIPTDIQRLKVEHPDEALRWRQSTRNAFMSHLARGYEISGFMTDPSSNRCYYVLQRPVGSQTEFAPPEPSTH